MNILSIYIRLCRRLSCLFVGKILSTYNHIKFAGMGITFMGKCSIEGNINIFVDRTANVCIGKNFRMISSSFFNPLCNKPAIINIGKNADLKIGENVGVSSPTIWIRKSLSIGDNVNLGGGVLIMDSDAHSLNYLHRRDGILDMENRVDKGIIIEEDVLVGANSIILKGVHIGARSIIGAGSIVTKDIPSDCIAAGNPAKIIKKINR